ncbi:MAG: hypothetical protein ACRD1I_09170 [Terriglobia bacterium]
MKRTLAPAVFLLLLSVSPARADTPPSYVELADAPTITVDWSKGNTQAVTLHGNRAMVFANGQKGGKYLLIVRQDDTGSRTVTWPASVHWPGGGPGPTLTTTANKKDYASFFFDGVTYDFLALSQNF